MTQPIVWEAWYNADNMGLGAMLVYVKIPTSLPISFVTLEKLLNPLLGKYKE